MEQAPNKHRVCEGDWICSDLQCGNLNFARRTSCNRCNKEREPLPKRKHEQEIGKAAAERSKGLFSADDWQCSKCCNVNWARRQQCNMCNAPKYADVEERTGYGGGYNDRGVVEYVKRDDSDDEYDEFGRKKKKYIKLDSKGDEYKDKASSTNSETQNTVERTSTTVDANEEEDEEEEEDDDDDLSKYDLTEWNDLADTNSMDNGVTKEKTLNT